ncbi:MAG TPA: 50S ribosomal protein L25/general stress protein Ctc [Geminicoccaceae bacterium]|nr:50S ribosomal protein L25/general stress protein Ctc [Geminicoccaceae bacterium]
MAELTSLAAEPREGVGKGASRSLRRAGRVPAVIYGEKAPQEMISLETRELRRVLQSARFFSTLCNLQVNGEAVRVLPREVQLHPVTDEPLHVDFVRVGRGATIVVTVPVVFAHEDISRGLKRSGVLNIVRRDLELLCPADSIPGEIVVDLKDADIGDSLHISQVALPEGVRPAITDRDFTIATISAPTVISEEEEVEAAEEAEEEEAREREAAEPEETEE